MDMTFTYHLVDSLPHGAVVARRIEGGEVVTYLSRAWSAEQQAVALGAVSTATVAHFEVRQRGIRAS